MRPDAAALAAPLALRRCRGLRRLSGRQHDADLVAGKQLFVKKCGSCHTLNRAGTKGATGPNLDQAFQRAEKDGFGEPAIRGVIKKQIEFPNREP